jgi:hypothetical protein
MGSKTFACGAAGLALALSLSPDAWAAENPQQRVGIEHNLYLGCLMDAGGGTTEVALRNLIEQCEFDPGIPKEEFVAFYSRALNIDPYLSVERRMQTYRSSYTDEEFSYFRRIDQVFATAAGPEEADRALAALEEQAVARFSGKTDGEASLLALLSTARHSLAYWSAPGSPLQQQAAQVGARKLKWWQKVLIVVGADCVGAGIGFLIGGPPVAGAIGAGASTGAGAAIANE